MRNKNTLLYSSGLESSYRFSKFSEERLQICLEIKVENKCTSTSCQVITAVICIKLKLCLDDIDAFRTIGTFSRSANNTSLNYAQIKYFPRVKICLFLLKINQPSLVVETSGDISNPLDSPSKVGGLGPDLVSSVFALRPSLFLKLAEQMRTCHP